jgi:hypothetical protein
MEEVFGGGKRHIGSVATVIHRHPAAPASHHQHLVALTMGVLPTNLTFRNTKHHKITLGKKGNKAFKFTEGQHPALLGKQSSLIEMDVG